MLIKVKYLGGLPGDGDDYSLTVDKIYPVIKLTDLLGSWVLDDNGVFVQFPRPTVSSTYHEFVSITYGESVELIS